jgi:ABC-type transport system involved in multi-copper enzyme maturation permease subunit
MRIGLGPVFACERSIACRRWQTYAMRVLFLTVLLGAMAAVASSGGALGEAISATDYAELGESYFCVMIGVELALVLLAAPAATAGAISLDRARGTLAHVLTTDLSDAEIVLGKLAARLAPIVALVAGIWPVMAISSLLGGIDPLALTLALAIIIAVAILGCSLALLLSVWARRTHEVVLAVYFFWAIALLAWPIWYGLQAGGIVTVAADWLLAANPFYLAFAPYEAPGQTGIEEYMAFFAVTLTASALAILLAVWRMRPATCRGGGKAHRRARYGLLGRLSRALPGPSLDGNPVLWREWHRLRPSAWMTTVAMVSWTTTTVTCAASAYWIWRYGMSANPSPATAESAGVLGYLILIFLGLLMISAVAPTSVAEERQRGSLDVLVATPLSTTAILLGKWWGTFRLVPFLAIGPGIFGLALATGQYSIPSTGAVVRRVGDSELGLQLAAALLLIATILAYGAMLTSLGLALATWIKRQSRAIAASVSLFVLLAIGWPILILIWPGEDAFGSIGLGALSPVFAGFCLGEGLALGPDQLPSFLWWLGLWDTAAAAAAIGLCWLAARTFDAAFGRIPERARSAHWLADVVIVVAGVTSTASLVRAIASWVQGVRPNGPFDTDAELTRSSLILIEFLGLILLAIVAALGAPDSDAERGARVALTATRSSLGIWLGRWWRVFRLALFLAVGPGLVTIALAASRDFWPTVNVADTSFGAPGNPGVMITHTTPSGETLSQYYTGDRSAPAVQAALEELSVHAPAPPLTNRLRDAGLLTLTLLAHAAAASTAGFVLALWIKRRRPRLAIAAGLALFVAVGWLALVYYMIGNHDLAQRLYTLSPLWVANHLLAPLIARRPHSTELIGWIAGWDAALAIFAVGGLYLTMRATLRRGNEVRARHAKSLDALVELEPSLVEV